MNADEYASQQAVISAQVARYVLNFSKFFARPALGIREWLSLLNMLFPEVQRQREASAALAREFYDAQRALHHPDLPRHDVFLEGSDFRHFVANMEPARARMQIADSPDHAVAQVVGQAVREVENAGRRQIIHAVQEDQALADKLMGKPVEQAPEPPTALTDLIAKVTGEPTPEPAPAEEPAAPAESPSEEKRLVRGWARVATGRETCAWCLMLVSRGPVYSDAHTAGLDLESDLAASMIDHGADVSEFMDQWHPNCDCKVVPVYKLDDWPGLEAQQRAEQLWIEATKEARRLIDSGQSRTDNHGTEALNALRRRIDHGDITSTEWSALSAA
ncbi:MAG: VG15 protein [Isosphaeraceae bacterium]